MRIVQAGITMEDVDGMDLLKRVERASRTCYKSEDRITDDSAIEFVKDIIKRGHEAMLEHASITATVICDRGVSHEIVRHRIASYAQESTRYCNYSKDKFGNEITVIDPSRHLTPYQYTIWIHAMAHAEKSYFDLLDAGAPAQMARSVLPNSLKTEIVITMNLREWRHFFKLRCAPNAHPQMRDIAWLGLLQFQNHVPVVFDDLGGTE